jgi:ribonuclease P protein subunit POP4
MKVTPGIIRCEFAGTEAEVVRSTHAGYIGLKGTVIDESRNTLTLSYSGQKKTVVKCNAVFHFRFIDGTIVEIDGELLVGRPEDRIKKHIRRLW